MEEKRELIENIKNLDGASLTTLKIAASALLAREEVVRNAKKQSK